jgi:hypothetical protein
MPAPVDQEGAFQGIVDAIKQGFKGDSDSAIKAVGSSSYRQAKELFDIHENMVAGFGTSSDTFKHMYDGVKELQGEFYSMSTGSGEALSSIFNNQGELIKEFQGIVSSNLLQIHAVNADTTAREMADLTLYGRALNFGTAQTQKFMERQFALTGEANDELLKQTLAYSKAIEHKTGISSKIIAENISGMMTDVKTFGNMTVEEMSEAAAAIAHVGVEVSSVAGLVNKFSTFEGAADSVSKLTQVFGVQMDTMKYMEASYESPQDMLAMMQEDFERAGVNMDNLNMAEKRLLAQATGMSISDVEKTLGQAGSDLASFTADVAGATAGVGQTEVETALANSGDNIAKINQMGRSAEHALQMSSARSRDAIASVFSEGIREISDNMGTLTNQGIRLLHLSTRTVKERVSDHYNIGGITDTINSAVTTGGTIIGDGADNMEQSVNRGDSVNVSLGHLSTTGGNLLEALNLEQGAVESPYSDPSRLGVQPVTANDSTLITSINASHTDGTATGALGVFSSEQGETLSNVNARLTALQAATATGAFTPEMLTAVLDAWKEAQDQAPGLQPINIEITDTGEAWAVRAKEHGVLVRSVVP